MFVTPNRAGVTKQVHLAADKIGVKTVASHNADRAFLSERFNNGARIVSYESIYFTWLSFDKKRGRKSRRYAST
ncbi:hypothetical protein D3C72_1961100 [compost metagenome]